MGKLVVVGEGTVWKIEVEPGMTLGQVLESVDLEYNPDYAYRAVNGQLYESDPVPTNGVLVYARAETNGMQPL